MLSASAGASPSTSSPTGNYGLSKIAAAQVSVLLSTLKAKEDDPVEYENKRNKLRKVRPLSKPPVALLHLAPALSLSSVWVALLVTCLAPPPGASCWFSLQT